MCIYIYMYIICIIITYAVLRFCFLRRACVCVSIRALRDPAHCPSPHRVSGSRVCLRHTRTTAACDSL